MLVLTPNLDKDRIARTPLKKEPETYKTGEASDQDASKFAGGT